MDHTLPDPRDSNPFASPQSDLSADPIVADEVWRDGELLIAHAGAELPHRCLNCGKPGAWRGVYKLEKPKGETKASQPHTRREWLTGWFVVLPLGLVTLFVAVGLLSIAFNYLPWPDLGIWSDVIFFTAASGVYVGLQILPLLRRNVANLQHSLCQFHRVMSIISTGSMHVFFALMLSQPLLMKIGYGFDFAVHIPIMIGLVLLSWLIEKSAPRCVIAAAREDGYFEIQGAGNAFLDTLPNSRDSQEHSSKADGQSGESHY